ncbi:BCL6A transcription repressor b [Trichomycterus rosablanca]|uniref:BCL6A transcription repressor b n=1 Tax=Trichomycterus rosablanca TaxID=2290929 RepID=UPI002F35DFB4
MSSAVDDCIQFTRHAGDVLFNFNRLRSRNILTDVTVLVGGREFHAHKAVLMACSGFFYSVFINTNKTDSAVVSLDPKADPDGFAVLLEFMYTSCLTLKEQFIVGTLNTAIYLQMEHMVETCRRFMESRGLNIKLPGEEPPACFRARSPPVVHYAVSTSTSNPTRFYTRPPPPPSSISSTKPHSWKIPHSGVSNPGVCPGGNPSPGLTRHPSVHISDASATSIPGARPPVLHQLDRTDRRSVKEEESELENFVHSHIVDPRSPLKSDCQPNSPAESSGCGGEAAASPKVHNWKKYKFIVLNENPHQNAAELIRSDANRSEGKCDQTLKDQSSFSSPTHTPRDENMGSSPEMRTGEKPYHCTVCGAQFNRPANLKTHLRIHSGEKPYKCDTCGSAFVQVAHLRAHVLIHTGEKPYSCSVCSTRFRHLQTLKSHMRIHTGEKPYHCEMCDLRFRHKSQLRLHLRQKHGPVTNNKSPHH